MNVFNRETLEGAEGREMAINRGNAFHEALKVLDFDQINNPADISNQREFLLKNIGEEYVNLLDFDLLYKNISLIKNVLKGQKAIKERKFIMQASLSESEIAQGWEDVIVQGIVDLMSIGERNILIDYKFTSQQDDKKLVEKYEKQIKLYSLAIEKAFGRKVDEKYLLSLKQAKLIRID